MNVIEFEDKYFEKTSELLANFRVTLRPLKVLKANPISKPQSKN